MMTIAFSSYRLFCIGVSLFFVVGAPLESYPKLPCAQEIAVADHAVLRRNRVLGGTTAPTWYRLQSAFWRWQPTETGTHHVQNFPKLQPLWDSTPDQKTAGSCRVLRDMILIAAEVAAACA